MKDTFTCITCEMMLQNKFAQKKGKSHREIWVKKKIWVKKNLGKKKNLSNKKFELKKIYVKKKNWAKKISPKKGQYPKRGTNCPKLVFPVCQVEKPRNHVYSPNFKRNG